MTEFDARAKLTLEQIDDLDGVDLVQAAADEEVKVELVEKPFKDLLAFATGQEQLGGERPVLSVDSEMARILR
jgi:hypothetical protein